MQWRLANQWDTQLPSKWWNQIKYSVNYYQYHLIPGYTSTRGLVSVLTMSFLKAYPALENTYINTDKSAYTLLVWAWCWQRVKRATSGLHTIFSWWEKVENGGKDGPKKGGSGRACGQLNGRRLLHTAIGLLLTSVMIGCLCGGEDMWGLREAQVENVSASCFCLSTTHVHSGSLSGQPCW